MSKKAKSRGPIFSALQMLIDFFSRLTSKVIELGGTIENLYSSLTNDEVIEKIAKVIVGENSDEKPKFRIWKTIELGTWAHISDLRKELVDNKHETDIFSNEMLGNMHLKLTTMEKCDLVCISPNDLGFVNNVWYDELCDKAIEMGLERCPAEAGPQLRIQYPNQPYGETLRLVMEPICIATKDVSGYIFVILKDGQKTLLRGDNEFRSSFFSPRSLFIFCLPKQKEVIKRIPKFKVWKTIELGTWAHISDLQKEFVDNKHTFDVCAKEMLGNMHLKLTTMEKCDLVCISPTDLGFVNNVQYDDLCAEAIEQGLELCPAEAGPQLRIQYPNQPFGEILRLAMKPINIIKDYDCIFVILRDGKKTLLRGDNDFKSGLFSPRSLFIFCLPKQKKIENVKPKFEVWKEIKLGSYKGTNKTKVALHLNNIKVKSSLVPVIDLIELSKNMKTVKLVNLTLAELGLNKSANYYEICKRAVDELGLCLCPDEVVVQLRLQYLDQINSPVFEYIATIPLYDLEAKEFIYYLEKRGDGFWIACSRIGHNILNYSNSRFIFCLPEQKNVEIVKPSFEVWKEIRLGVYQTNSDLLYELNNKKMKMYKEEILSIGKIRLITTETTIRLAKVSVGELGLGNGTPYENICSSAIKFGLKLCPEEAGPLLRIQYTEQKSVQDWVTVASKPIVDSKGRSNIYSVECFSDGLRLSLREVNSIFYNSAGNLIFQLPD